MAKKREGDLSGGEKAEDPVEEVREEEKEAEGRKRGGATFDGAAAHKHALPSKMKSVAPHHRKKGGGVPFGDASKGRPDRRARGGATSDTNPTTAAGNMSTPSYMAKGAITGWGGEGKDNPGKNG